ncbi:ESPR-type extended signal peptide-containing protein [Phascolarctobacterium succinatutens]|uniref:ESPR-type extended signal peptide-containing protein n=1 Tax=Phascolarctobacterium succinatutens TaxID=626940 RepID=UPI0026F0C95C|nr:ESPR-type extended signal peptide-containing protein [Phascolarctobacterium succinatutens]
MNKVFKVIWSEARNAYVVVSEIAKNHGSKSCSTKKLLTMLIATGVMTCASMAPAMAADPPAEALKHNTVAAGYNITVTPKDNSDGGKEYNVDLKNDIHLAGDDPDALVGISGSKGTIWATGRVTVGSGVDGSVVMDGTTATVSGLGNTTTAYDDFANGKGKAATEEQLKEISEVAENANQGWNLSTNGGEASKVAPGETVDFSGDQNINISNDGTNVKVELKNDIYLAGDDPDAMVNISGSKGTIEATGAIATKDRVYADKGAKLADIDVTGNKISNGASSIVLDGSNVKVNDKVTIDQNGKISGVAAGEVSKTSTDAINGSQLNQTNENVAALDKRVTQNEADIAQNKADIAQNKADIAQNKADIATNKANIEKNANDIATNKQNIDKLNTRVDGVEKLAKQHTTVTAGDNIAVTETTNKDGGKEYKVALDKDIKLDSVTANTFTAGQTVMNNDGLKVGKDVSVTATAVTAGKTSISDEGVKVGDKTYISADGLNANDQKITNVKAGDISETSKDAVNGSQLYKTNQEVVNNTNRINKLGSRVNKVGAGAAALAALHPMDFDPDDKLTFSAGYGNYAGENAAAIGAYYRPDEKVMFSVAGTVGNGENMVNAGVSFSLDRTNHVSNSRTAMAREILDLRAEVTELKAMVAKGGLGSIAEDKMKIFPDVAENHWAYEYVGKLAAAGIIEGYPDGKFSGDRMMSRYEFAAMLYRAMQKGAQLDSKIINEFAPEMGRIRVDRISGEDGDRDKIERVRVNAVKGERDHYGNKLAK